MITCIETSIIINGDGDDDDEDDINWKRCRWQYRDLFSGQRRGVVAAAAPGRDGTGRLFVLDDGGGGLRTKCLTDKNSNPKRTTHHLEPFLWSAGRVTPAWRDFAIKQRKLSPTWAVSITA